MPGDDPYPGRPRLVALDVVRGFALCGVLVANVAPIANVDPAAVVSAARPPGGALDWMQLFVALRFFPIFSLLFGIGFSLLLTSATHRCARPRLVLLRRLVVLLAIGLAHLFLLWRGDILTVYAAVGLLVLLPSTWLPRWVVAGLAAVLLTAALLLDGGHFAMVPGLFLLGSALTRYGVVAGIERSTRAPAVLGLVLAAGAAPVLWLQAQFERSGDVDGWGFRLCYPLAGLLLAGVYVCALLVLLRTPLRAAPRVLFEPLGRMALTNYLTATVLVLGVAAVHGHPERWSTTTVLVIAGAILAVQWLWSTCWLRHCRQGPLEWLWRWATWARRPPLRRGPDHRVAVAG
ncbi:DUF418 domain-containing protein [Pseudonocardia acaciae]|uniref:DUF418 domain-containing protein n=1 Tax=Pseudonocardia acaciae TaxID=551276 RepID=UPI00048D61D8|nr:DUF418 domain-containing protein [Pseudonocardia acaciae]